MIDLDGMISIPYLKKAVFTGSHKGMNFMIKKSSSEEGDKIWSTVWPGPFNFAVTEDEKKTSREFAFSQEGLKEVIVWLNEYYEAAFVNDVEP